MTVAVVDASVVVAALLDSGAEGRWAEDQVFIHDLAGPHLVLAEASNIMRRAVLSRQTSDEGASLAHADLLGLDIELFPFDPFASRVWQMRDNLTAYDAWYVALAEGLECSLLTLDGHLARAPGISCHVSLPGG
ncbi:MAG: type II toxin-antitoxin system VapC family toxin [Actinomycetota bacterium]|nr:type II toxin-antitoxin system VapC family toxin [Actinomycetota bacterium]